MSGKHQPYSGKETQQAPSYPGTNAPAGLRTGTVKQINKTIIYWNILKSLTLG